MSNLSESALHPVLRIPGGFEEEKRKRSDEDYEYKELVERSSKKMRSSTSNSSNDNLKLNESLAFFSFTTPSSESLSVKMMDLDASRDE